MVYHPNNNSSQIAQTSMQFDAFVCSHFFALYNRIVRFFSFCYKNIQQCTLHRIIIIMRVREEYIYIYMGMRCRLQKWAINRLQKTTPDFISELPNNSECVISVGFVCFRHCRPAENWEMDSKKDRNDHALRTPMWWSCIIHLLAISTNFLFWRTVCVWWSEVNHESFLIYSSTAWWHMEIKGPANGGIVTVWEFSK